MNLKEYSISDAETCCLAVIGIHSAFAETLASQEFPIVGIIASSYAEEIDRQNPDFFRLNHQAPSSTRLGY